MRLQKDIITSMDLCIPVSRSCPHQKPYWDAELKQCHDDQKHKRRVWIQEGRPRGMQYASYSTYKAGKRQFAKLLQSKKSQQEQSRFQNAEDMIELDSKQLNVFCLCARPADKLGQGGLHC